MARIFSVTPPDSRGFVFTAHDPGAKEHLRPLYQYAIQMGRRAHFLDLARISLQTARHRLRVLIFKIKKSALIAGCSSKQEEWPLLREAKLLGARTAMLVEIGPGDRLRGINGRRYPDLFLATSQACANDLVALGAYPDRVRIAGSAHLEALPGRSGTQVSAVRRAYNLKARSLLFSFFGCPDSLATIEAARSFLRALPFVAYGGHEVVIRLHPRSEKYLRTELEKLVKNYPWAQVDRRWAAPTMDLLRASTCSLTMGSTVSAESLALGKPSAFFQMGWDFRYLDRIFKNMTYVPKIRTIAHLRRFITGAIKNHGRISHHRDIERHRGALNRSWQAIDNL
ncbi:MAG: hypothetical protein HY547_08645 [Elusimicrobia bacterium]|nr:hypothetical protein [Elusimicrobiota bacterium]